SLLSFIPRRAVAVPVWILLIIVNTGAAVGMGADRLGAVGNAMIQTLMLLQAADEPLQLFVMLLQELQPLAQLTDGGVLRVYAVDDVVHHLTAGRGRVIADALSVAPDDTARNATDRTVGRNVLVDDGVGPDPAVVSDGDGAEDFGAHADQDPIADGGVALDFLQAGASERHLMVHQHVVADHRRLSDDDPHPVINEEAPSNGRARMNLDARKEGAELRDPARQQLTAMLPQPVGEPMGPEGVQAGVEQRFPGVARGRVFGQDGMYIFA